MIDVEDVHRSEPHMVQSRFRSGLFSARGLPDVPTLNRNQPDTAGDLLCSWSQQISGGSSVGQSAGLPTGL